jgi:hypothetical protein
MTGQMIIPGAIRSYFDVVGRLVSRISHRRLVVSRSCHKTLCQRLIYLMIDRQKYLPSAFPAASQPRLLSTRRMMALWHLISAATTHHIASRNTSVYHILWHGNSRHFHL